MDKKKTPAPKTKAKSVKKTDKPAPKAKAKTDNPAPKAEKKPVQSKSQSAQEKLEAMSVKDRKDLAVEKMAEINVVKNVKPKWFDQPDQRVSNRDLMKLKSRNSDEDSLNLLWELDVKEHIDINLLKRVRFNVDYKTKLTKKGCDIGAYSLEPINVNSQIFNLKKSTKKKLNTVA